MNSRSCFLIVDDSKVDQMVTHQLLKINTGISNIHEVNNGLEALAWLKSNANRPDQWLIIILDIKMPEMDGFAFLDAFELLDDRVKGITRIFMVSSTLDTSDIERARDHRLVEKLLTKPLPIRELMSLLTAP